MLVTLKDIKQKVGEQFTSNEGIYLLAFSGGMDSVVLAQLLLELEIPFELAHFNYQLRGEESEENMRFCIEFAKQNDLNIHTRSVNTEEKDRLLDGNLQSVARSIRYQWLFELMMQNRFAAVLTAHHADDQLETVLLHQFRGTGIAGLKGMSPDNGILKRPLLSFLKATLFAVAKEQSWTWSEDTSNKKDIYQRNFIRNQLVETIEQRFSNFRNTMLSNIRVWNDEAELLQFFISSFLKDKLVATALGEELKWSDLQALPAKRSVLHFWLGPFGFNETNFQMVEGVFKQYEGERMIQLGEARLRLLRDRLVLEPNKFSPEKQLSELVRLELGMELSLADDYSSYLVRLKDDAPTTSLDRMIFLSSEVLGEQIHFRRWQNGDRMRLRGLNGSKKISDLFTSYKLDQNAKNKALVIELKGKVIAVWPYRVAEGYDKNEKGQLRLEIDLLKDI